jgi:hypothetical protein
MIVIFWVNLHWRLCTPTLAFPLVFLASNCSHNYSFPKLPWWMELFSSWSSWTKKTFLVLALVKVDVDLPLLPPPNSEAVRSSRWETFIITSTHHKMYFPLTIPLLSNYFHLLFL